MRGSSNRFERSEMRKTEKRSPMEESMFDVELKDMTAIITVESENHRTLTASNVGVSPLIVFEGSRRYSYAEAVSAIERLDRALLSCSKCLYKRIRATRMQFVFAFGPEMESVVGPPPNQP